MVFFFFNWFLRFNEDLTFIYFLFIIYEVRTLFELDVFQYRIRVVSDTNTYNYTKSYTFFKIISYIDVLISVSYPMSVLWFLIYHSSWNAYGFVCAVLPTEKFLISLLFVCFHSLKSMCTHLIYSKKIK